MAELPRQRATESRVIRDAKAEPAHEAVAAAQTSENFRNHFRDRSFHTPMAVTASGTKRVAKEQGVGTLREEPRVLSDFLVKGRRGCDNR